MHLHSYPKVYAIGHAAVAELFMEPVLVEEKVDGSQFSFGRVGEDLALRSRGADITIGSNDSGMFKQGIATAQELMPILHDGWVYRCEYLQKPKHNVLAYGRVPNRNVILFDINTGDEVYLSREEKVAEAERLGLEFVPLMFQGMVSSPEQIYGFLENESVLGGNKVEGIVAKNYQRFGRDKKVLMGKFVREDFKEAHGKEWKATNPTMSDVVERIIATVKHERRWEKAMFHLRDAGKLENSPRDIPALIQAAQQDVRDEELDFIQKKLLEWALPRIIRASTGGLPEWYKKRLLESAFTAPEAE